MEKVYLSRRNLLTLLSKLDRFAAGEMTLCTVIKNDNKHPVYPQTMKQIAVIAVEDEEYYTDRSAGPMNPADEARLTCTECLGSGIIEGLDTFGGCATFEACHYCKG